MKPLPVTTPCRIFALLGTLTPITDIAVCTRPQLAIATNGKVRRPALWSSGARCHPIGNARTNASSRWTRWSRLSPHRPKMLALDVPECREHTRVEVIQQMAVEGPQPRIVGIESDDHAAARCDQHGVAHCAQKPLSIDLDDL